VVRPQRPGAPESPPRSQLERRYRSVLRVLPAGYRAAWEEDMAATFMARAVPDDPEEAEYAADFGHPGWSEVASVLALAVRLRLPGLRAALGVAAGSPGGTVRGEAAGLVIMVGLLVNAALALAEIGSRAWSVGLLPWLPTPPAEVAPAPPAGFWHLLWVPAAVAWILAYLALLLGNRRAAVAVAAVAVLPDLVRVVAGTGDLFTGAHPYLVTLWCGLLVDLVLLAALALAGRDRPARMLPWLLALPLAVATVWGVEYLTYLAATHGYLEVLDWPGLCAAVLVIATGVHMALPATRRGPRARYRVAALAVLAALVFAVRSLTMIDYLVFAPAGQRPALIAVAFLEAAAVFAAGLPMVLLAARGAGVPVRAPARGRHHLG
jgi:hypothetical protein